MSLIFTFEHIHFTPTLSDCRNTPNSTQTMSDVFGPNPNGCRLNCYLLVPARCCCHDREAFNLDAALVTVELSTDDVSGEEASDCW